MAPFAGHAVAPADDLAIHHNAAAAASADDHAEHHAGTFARAVRCLAERKTIGVVRHPHLPLQPGGQIGVETLAVQRDGVGVLHPPRGGADHAGDAHPHAAPPAQALFDRADEAGNRLQRGGIAGRRCHTLAQCQAAIRGEDGGFDLGAAKIDADAKIRRDGVGVHGASLPSRRLLLNPARRRKIAR